MDREEYLGDGLHISFDGWHYTLRTERADGDHYVYIERGPALKKLLAYIRTSEAWAEQELVKAEKAEARIRDAREDFPD